MVSRISAVKGIRIKKGPPLVTSALRDQWGMALRPGDCYKNGKTWNIIDMKYGL